MDTGTANKPKDKGRIEKSEIAIQGSTIPILNYRQIGGTMGIMKEGLP